MSGMPAHPRAKQVDTPGPGLLVQALFLTGKSKKQSTAYTAGEYQNPQDQAEQRHHQRTQNQPAEQRSDAPVNELARKAFVNKGLL